jgi:hypothetical protein
MNFTTWLIINRSRIKDSRILCASSLALHVAQGVELFSVTEAIT